MIPSGGAVRHRFSPLPGADLVRARIRLGAEARLSATLRLIWRDEDLEQLASVTGGLNSPWKDRQIDFFSAVPEGASFGELYVRPRLPAAIELISVRLDYLALEPAEPLVAGSPR